MGTIPVIDTQPYVISGEHNEETIPQWEDSIHLYPKEFYKSRPIFSASRIPQPSVAVMSSEQETDLRAIKSLLEGVDSHIIVGPMLSKTYLDSSSVRKMQSLFGERFHDFSQSMQWTADVDTNYYDEIHYRHPVATMILDSIYKANDYAH